MAHRLPDPPPDLGPNCLAFYSELRRMLEALRPRKLDAERTSVSFDKRGLEVILANAEDDDWDIWASVAEDQIIAGAGLAHEHFEPSPAEERAWPSVAVDFIAELLRGEVLITRTYRGNSLISVRHQGPEQASPYYTGLLTPARLMFWREKRQQTERVSFGVESRG